MQVIILATDEQRKLPPLSDALPAPMLPIVDRPVMATTVEILARSGQKQILLSLYERGGQIASYFGEGRRWGVDLKHLTQRQAWGSAGSLRFAAGLLYETFMVLPGEALIDLDIEAALAFHRSHGRSATAIVHRPVLGSTAPQVQLGADRRLELGAAEGQCLTGAYIFEPAVLRHIPANGDMDIAAQLLPALIAAGEVVYGYEMSGYWNPLHSLEAFQEAQQVYIKSAARKKSSDEPVESGQTIRFPSLEARQVAPGVWVGRDHSIHPSVKIAAPVYIGSNSWIGREVELGPQTVIGSNVVIDDEATLARSTVLDNTYVGRLVRIDDRIVTPTTISDAETGETTRVVDPFLIGRVGPVPGGRRPLRRSVSAVATAILLLMLSPLLLLVALISLLTTGGQPIVRLARVGQRPGEGRAPRVYHMLRFKTRRSKGSYVLFGRLLERLEFHRLPELFNVLSGDMALVGVKPLSLKENESLKEEWHQRRHDYPAGFTGLWYLQTDADSDLDTVMVTDVYYTAMRTWRGDMLLLLRTPLAWVSHVQRGHEAAGEREYHFQTDNVQSM